VNTLMASVMGACVGVGLLRLRAAWRGRADPAGRRPLPSFHLGRSVLRCTVALAAASAAWVLTDWPVAGAMAAAAGWWAPTAWAARGRSQREQALVEAVATWAEQLRDTLSAASGLEHAVAATAAIAEGPLSGPLRRLAERLERKTLGEALRRFAAEARHPTADFVVAALITASEHEARDVGALLGHLAVSARDEARLRRRVWVGRARTRAATRLIAGVIVVVTGGLKVLNPGYLDAYGDPTGQGVLTGIVALFVVALAAMERLSRLGLPERFTLRAPVRGMPL